MSPLGLARPADCGYDRVGARPPNFTDSDEATSWSPTIRWRCWSGSPWTSIGRYRC